MSVARRRSDTTGDGLPFFTISRKIAAGYLAMALFGLVSIAYALSSLHQQTARSERLVSVDFESLSLLRELRQHLLAGETLEKQYLILQDHSLLDLLNRRQYESSRSWRAATSLLPPPAVETLDPLLERFREGRALCHELLIQELWEKAAICSREEVGPVREKVLGQLDHWIQVQEGTIDDSLAELTASSQRAYRFTWMLALLGIAISAPVAITVVFGLRSSVRTLVRATREISAGSLEHRVEIDRDDEFGLLAREFTEMGRKLREMEKASLDANPLTRLPGNLAIDREIEARIAGGAPFAHLYIDLDNFKAFGDRYGYPAGSDVISWVGDLVRRTVHAIGGDDDLVGHIGGDDYVVLTAVDKAEETVQRIIEEFDRGVARFYTDEDRTAGYFIGPDRYGVERKIPLLTMSVAIVCSETLDSVSLGIIGEECARMKAHLKTLPGSNYLIDRRRR